MPDTQPTVFISSTIYDFRDLRSAIKYVLEELGYRVLLSEFNDFTKPLDRSSYDACIEALQQAHYFILLIGGRTGGWYHAAERVSITQHEYRTAYELARTGRMKLLTFVRSEIWTIRADRAALRDLLELEYKTQRELTDDDVAAITRHESTLVGDSDAVFTFLREVSRADEMKAATVAGTGFPVANWVHQFTTFRDVLDVLRTEFRMTQRLSRVVIVEGLKRELLSILRAMTWKSKAGKINLCTFFGSTARTRLGATYQSDTQLSGDELVWLVMYATVFRLSGSALPMQFTDHALLSGEFLAFDHATDGYVIAGAHGILQDLRENVARLSDLIEMSNKQAELLFDRYGDASRVRRGVTIPSRDLVSVLAVFDCQANVIRLATSLYAHLIGLVAEPPSVPLNPTSPITAEAEQLEREKPMLAEIDEWIRLNYIR